MAAVLALTTAMTWHQSAPAPVPALAPAPALAAAEAGAVAQRPAVEPRCDRPAAATAAGWARQQAQLPSSQWGAADGSVSVALPDGRSVWLYGDTATGSAGGQLTGFEHSSAVVHQRGCLHVSGDGSQLLPDGPGGVFSWPAGAIALDATHLLVSTGQEKLTGSCMYCFTLVSLRAAILTVTPSGDVQFTDWIRSWPQWTGHVVWGAGLARAGDTVVMYGLSPTGLGRDLYVATASVADALAGRWTLAPTPVATGVDPAGVSAYRDRAGWHVVTLRGTEVVSLNGPTPAGPFTVTTIATVPASSDTHVFYDAVAHPEVRLAGGGLLVTVCQNWADTQQRPFAAYRPLYLTAHQPANPPPT